jgi:AraC family transcriptional regulator
VVKPFDLLNSVLSEIEKGLKEGVNADILAEKFSLSAIHLRRLFKFAFRQSIGMYIHSRKLSASIWDLLNTSLNILDIAMEYGFGYEQSYIRAFKREFGLTPGELRKAKRVVKITPPLHLFDNNRLEDGLIFGPDIVMVPQFHVVGKQHKVPFRDTLTLSSYYLANQFQDNEKIHIPSAINPNVGITINSNAGFDADYYFAMPSVEVKSADNIPEGFDCYTFPSSLCARFRYIGTDNSTLNMATADEMFRAIDDFMDCEYEQYFLERKRINIDMYSPSTWSGIFCQWEWFAPVIRKTKNEIPTIPAGIFETYSQEMPALCFIGKKYLEPYDDSFYKKALTNLDNWRINRLFDTIEKQTDIDPKTIYEGGDSYTILMKNNDGVIEYWIGMFMPKGTGVPAGYEKIDFPRAVLEVCRVYGKRDLIINYDADCKKRIAEEGIYRHEEGKWFFQRFNWHRFFEEDKFGKRILEYCYYV